MQYPGECPRTNIGPHMSTSRTPLFRRQVAVLIFSALCFGTAVESNAFDRYGYAIGPGKDKSYSAQFTLRSDWNCVLGHIGNWHITGHWEFNISRWAPYEASDQAETVYDVGITPLFRIRPYRSCAQLNVPYIEAAVGVHYLTETEFRRRKFSTHFQFGDYVGAGIQYGDSLQYELGLRFAHHSNADLDTPNIGIDFLTLHWVYKFR